MSSTPLFDSIARRTVAPGVATPSATATGAQPTRDVAEPARQPARQPVQQLMHHPVQQESAAVPSSPMTAPSRSACSALVPQALVAAIDEIPTRLADATSRELPITDEQRAVVEALGDTFIRVLVDTLSTEIDRIVRDRAVPA